MKIIHPFVRTEEKVKMIAEKMKNNFLYCPDEVRTDAGSKIFMDFLFGGKFVNEHYEIGDFGGLVSAVDIIDGDRCIGGMKLWDKSLWGKGLIREVREVMDDIMTRHNLKRIDLTTPDPKMAKLAILCGMRFDKIKKGSFLFDGKAHDSFLMSKEK